MIAAESFRRVSDLFHAALDVPSGAARDRFLAAQTEETETVLAEVRALLEAHEQEQAALREANAAPRVYRFGPYETVRLLGCGGMGSVYLA